MFNRTLSLTLVAAMVAFSAPSVAQEKAKQTPTTAVEESVSIYDTLANALELSLIFPVAFFGDEGDLQDSFTVACRVFNTDGGVGVYGLTGGVGACIEQGATIVAVHTALGALLEEGRTANRSEEKVLLVQFFSGFEMLAEMRDSWIREYVQEDELRAVMLTL